MQKLKLKKNFKQKKNRNFNLEPIISSLIMMYKLR